MPQHPIYQALKEYGRIHKTVYILRYLQDVALRQTIQKQLSKIEQSNGAATVVSPGPFSLPMEAK